MRPKAVLVSLTPDTRELEELVWSLGYDVVDVVVQRRERPDPGTFLGEGKLDETAERAFAAGATLVAVNAALKPGQVFAMERHFRHAQRRRDRRASMRTRGGADEDEPEDPFVPLDVSRLSASAVVADAPEGDASRATPDERRSSASAGAGRPPDLEGVQGDPGPRGAQGRVGGGPRASAHSGARGAARRAEEEALARSATRRNAAQRSAAPTDTGAGAASVEADPGAPIQVFDRVRVILDIFSERARSPEARLQVEYARLQYETPLVKEVIHLAKKGEHPGFLGGGRYEVNYYYMMMSRRMAKIRRELDRIAKEREVRRKHRRRGGFRLVSLAGYTNAGKSSLLEALASEDIRRASGEGTPFVIENRYFSTLATTTRRAHVSRDTDSGPRPILLTDTVGFIEHLPPWMVEAFHSTLEEIALADCVLLVVDASEPVLEVERKARSSFDVLASVHARLRGEKVPVLRAGDAARRIEAPLVVVLNKVDLLSAEEIEERREALLARGLLPPGAAGVAVSARQRRGLDDVIRAVVAALPPPARLAARLPMGPATESALAWLHSVAGVQVARGEDVRVRLDLDPRDVDEATSRIRAAGGEIL